MNEETGFQIIGPLRCQKIHLAALGVRSSRGLSSLFHGVLIMMALADRSSLLFHNLREGDSWFPTNGVPCAADLGVQLIHLLQGKTFGLIYHEVNESNAKEAASEPNEENFGLQIGIARAIIHQVRGRVGDGPVEQPISGGGYR